MKKIALFAGLALAASAVVSTPALAQTPADGKWAVEAKTDFGTFKSHWVVGEAAGAATVEVTDVPVDGFPAGTGGTVSEVKIEGNVLTFKRHVNFGDMPIDLTYTATFTGDTLAGTASSSFGPTPITGTRE